MDEPDRGKRSQSEAAVITGLIAPSALLMLPKQFVDHVPTDCCLTCPQLLTRDATVNETDTVIDISLLLSELLLKKL